MFNLPNNTPYALVIEADTGYLVMTCRWVYVEGEEMGPKNTFDAYDDELSALAAVERFLANETD